MSDTPTIKKSFTITPLAVENVLEMLKQRNLEGHALRIYVAGSPQAFNFGMAIEANVREEDFKAEIDGLTVVVDMQTLDYLDGGTVDFVADEDGGGFTIENPNLIAKPTPYGNSNCGSGGCGSICGSGGCGSDASCC
jgi:iron-sulfur cluster assembly protein